MIATHINVALNEPRLHVNVYYLVLASLLLVEGPVVADVGGVGGAAGVQERHGDGGCDVQRGRLPTELARVAFTRIRSRSRPLLDPHVAMSGNERGGERTSARP